MPQLVMQFIETFGQPATDGIGGNSQLLGDFAVGEVFNVKKGDGVFAGFFELF
jgi:hypothetical protein